jgi:hypothetical protein
MGAEEVVGGVRVRPEGRSRGQVWSFGGSLGRGCCWLNAFLRRSSVGI